MPPFAGGGSFGKGQSKLPGKMKPRKPKALVDTGGGRSGGKLGAVAHNPGVSTGMHFGHHKADSPQPAQQAGLANQFNHPQLEPSVGQGAIGMAGQGLLTYFPPLECFQSNTMDVYANNGAGPPPAGQARSSSVNILITGTFPEGSRSRANSNDAYTHIILCDAYIEIHDGYLGNASNPSTTGDILKIPSGVANYWVVIFAFVTQIPGVGRKKVVLADRRGTVGDFTKLL